MPSGSQSVVAWLKKPWMCVSTRPGATHLPEQSTTSTPSGASCDQNPNFPSSTVRYPPRMTAAGRRNLAALMAYMLITRLYSLNVVP